MRVPKIQTPKIQEKEKTHVNVPIRLDILNGFSLNLPNIPNSSIQGYRQKEQNRHKYSQPAKQIDDEIY